MTPTSLARKSIIYYLTHQKYLPMPKEIDDDLKNQKSACFVSLHIKDRSEGENLRGCIGTISPTQKNLSIEIIKNAVSAAINDPRFQPLNKNELSNIKISVDVLEKPEPVENIKDLDPKKYGVIVKSADGKTGLLLPDIEGVDTVEQQIEIAKQKAGITNENCFIYRFEVKRYEE